MTTRATIDLRGPEVALHASAGRECAPPSIPVTGGILSSPVLTMKTRGGDPYTRTPGVGTASMSDTDSLRLVWTAADMAVLCRGPRPVEYRIDVAGSIDGGAPAMVLGGTLTVYPTTWGREIPRHELGTLVLNGGSTINLAVTVPAPDGPIDGGYMGDTYGGTTGIDEGLFTSTAPYTTTHDGGFF